MPVDGVVPRSFLILYTSREGSTALIDQLRRHPSICASPFEHLDLHYLERVVERPRERIAEILDQALRTGDVPGQPPTCAGQRVIGFKWRPFGGAEAVDVIRRNRCRVIYLYRRDALPRALSMAWRPGHTQFAIANAAPAEREAALVRARSARFVADPAAVAAILSQYTKQKSWIWHQYCQSGLDVSAAEYEHFALDPLSLLNGVVSFLGLAPFAVAPATRFTKTTSRNIESQCDNIDEVRSDMRVRNARRTYARFLEATGLRQRRRRDRWRIWSR